MTVEQDQPSGILGEAQVMGGLCWIERSMFETLGNWSTSESDPVTVLAMDDHAHRHAWHADVLFDRLPELSVVEPRALVVAPDTGVSTAIDTVRGASSTLLRLVGGYRVMGPYLIFCHRTLLDLVDSVSSPSTHRWIRRILDDLVDEWMWGEGRIRQSIHSAEDLTAAMSHQAAIEALLIESRNQ